LVNEAATHARKAVARLFKKKSPDDRPPGFFIGQPAAA